MVATSNERKSNAPDAETKPRTPFYLERHRANDRRSSIRRLAPREASRGDGERGEAVAGELDELVQIGCVAEAICVEARGCQVSVGHCPRPSRHGADSRPMRTGQKRPMRSVRP